MKKITLNFDEVTGQVIDATGYFIGTYLNVKPVEPDSLEISKLIKLKDAGFDTDEIIKMHKEGLL